MDQEKWRSSCGEFKRTSGVQTHMRSNVEYTVERKPSQLVSRAVALAGRRSPSLPACAVVVIYNRTWTPRSNAKTSVRSNAWPVFKRRPVTWQSINRSLSSFGREIFFFGRFLRALCHCKPCSALFNCNHLL
jgi:hypothetical protein